MKRVDERDVIFARMSYKEGSPQFKHYYSKRPDNKDIDDSIRELPKLGEEGAPLYNSLNSPMINSGFEFLSDIRKYCEGKVNSKKAEIDSYKITEKLKELCLYYGAKIVGTTEMKEWHYYSHRGRPEESYGEKIEKFYKYGIVFAVEMDKEMIYRAPKLEEGLEVVKGYVNAAVIGMMLSYYIRSLGYEARNHMDGNYLVVLPLVAEDAGLGQMGRNGLLITKEYGPRVRLGMVTTNIPLISDEKEDFGVIEFCNDCGKCTSICPAKAIPSGVQTNIDGVKRWKIYSEKCYRHWRGLGSDCGICLASCPFSDNISLELIEKIKNSNEIRKNILKDYEKKYKVRPFIKEKTNLMK